MTIRDNLRSITILGVIIVTIYFPITILGHTANTSLNLARTPVLDFTRDYGCFKNCGGPYNFTIDPGADGDAIWPVMRLAAELYIKGIAPLWNPYLAAGTPLAADTINFVFSPLMMLYLLPNSLWDIPLLVSIWLAGIFTYFLLRSWKLGFLSSITGSTIFMLGGAITWYLPHDSVPVVIFTPLILFSIEKTLQNKDFKYVVLGSVALTFSILGGHLESIALVLLFCLLYAIFRILYMVFSRHKLSSFDDSQPNGLVRTIQTKKRIILKVIIIFFGGLGLSAFFIIPVAEFVVNGVVGRDVIAGIAYSPAFTIATTFMPYFLGSIHVYAIPATSFMASWNVLGGYVIASSLVFSLLGITFSNQLFQSSLHKRIAQFFFTVSIFFMFKSIGISVINLIGYLPVLDHVVFPRYDGFIYTLGLAISAAFGIEVIIQRKIGMKHLGILTIVSFLIVILMALLIIPYFTWNGLASYYVIFQVLEALFFILAAFLSIVAYQRNNRNVTAMFFIFFLEAALYIPFGLPTVWQFYRSIVAILGIVVLCVVAFLPIEKKFVSINRQNTKLVMFVIITALTIGSQLIVYLESPQGLLLRHDAFSPTPITEFLRSNIDNYRIFSFDSMFRPNHPAAYQIQTLGILSAQNVNSFNSFFHHILDPYAMITHFDYIPSWRMPNAPSLESTFQQNQKYYDFLGVKYIVASSTNPNSQQTVMVDSWHVIGSTNNIMTQTFTAISNDIVSVSIQLGTYDRINHGDIILTMDSIPYDRNFHRVSQIKAEDVMNGAFNSFSFEPLEHAKGKNFSMTLSYPQAILETNAIAVAIHNENYDNSSSDHSIIKLGQLYADRIAINGFMNVIPYSSKGEFPVVFASDNLKVYENKNAFPRAFLVNQFYLTNSYESAQNIIKDQNFDLKNTIALERKLPFEQINLLNSSKLDENSSADILSYSANKVSIHTKSNSASLLILTDTYYPGWKAFVDGKETTIYRADGLVRAVFVPAGNHLVEFSYMPNSFVFGVAISFVTAGILLGIVVYLRKVEKH